MVAAKGIKIGKVREINKEKNKWEGKGLGNADVEGGTPDSRQG